MVEQKLKGKLCLASNHRARRWQEEGKSSKEYFDLVPMCYMDAEDMKKIGVKSNHQHFGNVPMRVRLFSKQSSTLVLQLLA